MDVTYGCRATFCSVNLLIPPPHRKNMSMISRTSWKVSITSPGSGLTWQATRWKSGTTQQRRIISSRKEQKSGCGAPPVGEGLSPKPQSHWSGPFVVVNKINDVVVRIQKSANSRAKVVRYDRLAPYHETSEGPETISGFPLFSHNKK
jgi:hypothetical protein